MYIETWHKFSCPGCEEINWACDGNLQDYTANDLEAIKCYKCGKKFAVDPDNAFELYDFEEGEEVTTLEAWLEKVAHCEHGKPKPE